MVNTESQRFDKSKVVRTVLYGDVYLSDWELRLLHTPLMQRLYDLKQLGFADRVFPDAVHSRLNHVIGVVEVTERMIRFLTDSCRQATSSKTAVPSQQQPVTATEVIAAADTLRLAALLHDLTHAPFGHTLEDEVCVFETGHESAGRQVHFFNQLLLEFVESVLSSVSPPALWASRAMERTRGDRARAAAAHKELIELERKHKLDVLRDFGFFVATMRDACVLLLGMYEWERRVKAAERGEYTKDPNEAIRQDDSLHLCAIVGGQEFEPKRDAWKADVIGNTICADLLDYARRDVHFAGLVSTFDDRIYRYLEIRVRRGLPRVAIRIFTSKIRLDVLSEILNILKVRYLLSERVLFHPTKCAAGAMLGRAATLLGKHDSDERYWRLGDREMLVAWRNEAATAEQFATALGAFAEQSDRGRGSSLREQMHHPSFSPTLGVFVARWNEALRAIPDAALGQRGTQWGLSEETDTPLQVYRQLRRSLRRPAVVAAAQEIADGMAADSAAARRLLDGLLSRQYYKPVYQVTRQAAEAHSLTAEDLVRRMSNPRERQVVEQALEAKLSLNPGSIIIYCPRRRTTLKEARVLVAWSDSEEPEPFRDLSRAAFRSFTDESLSIEEKYLDIWSMYVFVPEALLPISRIIQKGVRDELGIENSALLEASLSRDSRARVLQDVIQTVDDVHVEALVEALKVSQFAEASVNRENAVDFYVAYRSAVGRKIDEKNRDA